jgi:hypothetical protein
MLVNAMERVTTSKGSAAILHYLAAANMVLTGGEHKQLTDAEFTEGLRQWIADQPEVKLRKFTNYLMGAMARKEPAHVRANGQQPGASALEAEAKTVLTSIRNLVQTQAPVPGRGERKVIPKTGVQALGAAAVQAYDAIGGADRILATTGETMGFLIRDFTQSYVAAKRDPRNGGAPP